MENSAAKLKAAVVSAAICMLCVGLMFFGTGCPFPPVPPCTTDADCPGDQVCNLTTGQCGEPAVPCTSDDDCDDGEVCNVDTGECELAPTGCTSDDDCEEGEFCDTGTGECVVNEQVYETAEFDHDFHRFDQVIGCTQCHHEGAGLDTGCDTCHNRDEVVGGIPVLKDAMHNPDTGCWFCHDDRNDDGTRDCSVCHTGLDDL